MDMNDVSNAGGSLPGLKLNRENCTCPFSMVAKLVQTLWSMLFTFLTFTNNVSSTHCFIYCFKKDEGSKTFHFKGSESLSQKTLHIQYTGVFCSKEIDVKKEKSSKLFSASDSQKAKNNLNDPSNTLIILYAYQSLLRGQTGFRLLLKRVFGSYCSLHSHY